MVSRGKITDQEIDLKEGLLLKEKLAQILAENSGQDLEKLKNDMERDYWMSAEEAVEYGLVDKINKARKIALRTRLLVIISVYWSYLFSDGGCF